MSLLRRIATLVALLCITAPAVAGSAGAQQSATGAGTASATATILDVALGGGDALSLKVIGDNGGATTEGAPEAFVRLDPLSLNTPVEALNITVPGVEVRSTGGEQSENPAAVSFDNVAVAGSLVPAALLATVDELGAKASQTSGLADLSIAGGLLSVDSVTNQVIAGSSGSATESTRGVVVDAVNALDLGAVLDGLGLSLGDLPLDQVLGLLGSLGLPVAGVGDAADVQSAVNTLNAAIDTLQAETGNLTQEVCTTVDGTLGTIGGLTGIGALPSGVTCTTVETVTAPVNDTIDALQAELATVLADVLATLEGAPLLSADGLTVSMTAKATDSVETSVAEIVASLGGITVGGTQLPGIGEGVDLASVLSTVTALADQATGTVNGVLAGIHPGLGSLVDVDLFEQTESVTEANGVVNAVAGITALRATITPPADLGAIVSTVLAQGESVTSVIEGLGGTVPELSTAMSTLEQTLGLAVSALSQPAAVTVGVLGVTATHAVSGVAAPPPGGELPRTGTTAAVTAFGGVLLAGTAIAIRRWLSATAPQH